MLVTVLGTAVHQYMYIRTRTCVCVHHLVRTDNCISAHVYGQNALAGMQLRNGASGRTAAQETLRNGACPPTTVYIQHM